MFEKLADFVIRRYKLVILVWIVVLFYVFPLVFKINDVVVYQETQGGIDKLEAVKAENIISEQFAGQVPPTTIMIVIQDSNVLSAEVRDFTWTLSQEIATDGALQGVRSVEYLYTSLQYYYASIVLQAWDLFNQTTQTSQMIFGMATQVANGHMAMKVAYPMLNDTAIRASITSTIHDQVVNTGADNYTVNLTMGYVSKFYDSWLGSNYTLQLSELTVLARDSSMLYFGGQIGGDVGGFAVLVSQSLSVATYNSTPALQMFVENMLAMQIHVDPAFIHEAWSIAQPPTMAAAAYLAMNTILTSNFTSLPLIPGYLVSQFVNTNSQSTPNNTMLMVLPLTVDSSSNEAEKDVRELRRLVSEHLAIPGISVYVSGDPALNIDMMDSVSKDTSRVDPVTIILVLLLVAIFFRSAVTPWIPLMTVGMAYLTSTAAIYIVGKYVMEIHYSVLMIILTVMLGAGTDYCIFMMSRYREERTLGKSKEEAVRTSLIWAGESIATSGATVMIGFGVLMIGTYSLVRSMGMALVIAVGMALLFALTMLPSLLMLVGDKVFWPHTMKEATKRAREKEERGGGYFRKSARFALKNRKLIVIAALLISLPAAYLVVNLESSYDFLAGLPNAESKKGIDAMGDGFGKGNIMPTNIVVVFDHVIFLDGAIDPVAASQLEDYAARLLGGSDSNVFSVAGPTRPFGTTINQSYVANLSADDKATFEYAIRSSIGADNRTVLLTVVLKEEPFSKTSIHTIDRIRKIDAVNSSEVFGPSTQVLVGGATASMADISRSVSSDFFTMRIVAIVGIYVVLMLVLGSLLIPLRLVLTVLMNVAWTIAMTMIVFQFAIGVPVLWMLPLILFVIAMGLGMDYDIFLTTRIREEVAKGKTDEEAIMTAVERTGGIITACGMVMAGAFGSMMLSSTALLREFGFGLAFAILLDAMIVRIYLVPAIMLLLQKWNWYAPGRLQRVRREEKARKH